MPLGEAAPSVGGGLAPGFLPGTRVGVMVEVSIGEFARLSRLSPKALRLYDELGLLPPARVDPGTGYRWYETGQLERAGLVASLRRIGVPLAQVGELLELDSAQAVADRVIAYWSGVEAEHAARRDLTGYLVRQLTGDSTDLYQVATRERARAPAAVPQAERGPDRGLDPGPGVHRHHPEPAVAAAARPGRGHLHDLPRRGQRGQRRAGRVVPAGAR